MALYLLIMVFFNHLSRLKCSHDEAFYPGMIKKQHGVQIVAMFKSAKYWKHSGILNPKSSICNVHTT